MKYCGSMSNPTAPSFVHVVCTRPLTVPQFYEVYENYDATAVHYIKIHKNINSWAKNESLINISLFVSYYSYVTQPRRKLSKSQQMTQSRFSGSRRNLEDLEIILTDQ